MSSSILRASLKAPLASGTAGPSSAAFVLPCKKLVLEYCEVWGSNKGMRDFVATEAVRLAERFPGVEMVVKRVENRHPHLRGSYVNGQTKVICVRNLPSSSILAKADLLLASSGAKIASLKRPKVESTTESVRGMWSQFHVERS